MGWLDASHTSPATPAFLIPPALHGFENLRFEQAEAAGLGTALQETQDSVPSSARHSGSETNASPCSPATTSVPETALRAWLLMTSSLRPQSRAPHLLPQAPAASPGVSCCLTPSCPILDWRGGSRPTRTLPEGSPPRPRLRRCWPFPAALEPSPHVVPPPELGPHLVTT